MAVICLLSQRQAHLITTKMSAASKLWQTGLSCSAVAECVSLLVAERVPLLVAEHVSRLVAGHVSRLVAQVLRRARRSFDNAVLCGVMDTKTGQAKLNPSDDCLLDTHHRLVFLSSTPDVKPSKQVTASSYTRTTVNPQRQLYAKTCVDFERYMHAFFCPFSLSGFLIQRVCSFLAQHEARCIRALQNEAQLARTGLHRPVA